MRAIVLLVLILGSQARATLSLPGFLTPSEQQLVLQTLCFGTSFRPVDNPYPLGGFSGVEFGVSAQSIPTGDIANYGSHAAVNDSTIYPLVSFGKGILDNIDFLFSFVPYSETTGIGIYSGGFRWSFYQPTFVPASFSILVSATNSNFNNQFMSQSAGADLITSVNVDPFAFFVGLGTLYGQANFANNITYDGSTSNQNAHAFHTMMGMSFSLAQFFAAAEVDTYNATVVSLKLGTRL